MRDVGCELWGVGVWGRGLRLRGWWLLRRVKGMYCKGLRQGAEVRIGPSPYRSNVICLTYVLNFLVIILKLPELSLNSFSFELQKVRTTKLYLPQIKKISKPS